MLLLTLKQEAACTEISFNSRCVRLDLARKEYAFLFKWASPIQLCAHPFALTMRARTADCAVWGRPRILIWSGDTVCITKCSHFLLHCRKQLQLPGPGTIISHLQQQTLLAAQRNSSLRLWKHSWCSTCLWNAFPRGTQINRDYPFYNQYMITVIIGIELLTSWGLNMLDAL